MGNYLGTRSPDTSSRTTTTINFRKELNSYEVACKLDEDIQSFDRSLQARTSHIINTLAAGAEVHALSFDSLKEVTECLLEMDQEVVKVILECKTDIWKSQELFELVKDYFENSLQALDFCTVLEKCLKCARDSQLFIHLALQQYEEEKGKNRKYAKSLDMLRNFKALGDPFAGDFIEVFRSVHRQQTSMLHKLQAKKKKLDKKLRYVHSWRKVSSVIFIATFASVLICSVVTAAVGTPALATALAAASSILLGSMGKWIDSLFDNYENVIRGQKEVLSSMQVGTYVAIKDLDNIRVLVDRLDIEIESLLNDADFTINEEAVKVGIGEIKKKLGVFMKNVEDLGVQADVCGRDIRRARTVVLQRHIRPPTH